MRVWYRCTEAKTHPDVELDAERVAVDNTPGDEAEMVVGVVGVRDGGGRDDGRWAEVNFEWESDHDRFVDVWETHAEVSRAIMTDGPERCRWSGSHKVRDRVVRTDLTGDLVRGVVG